MKTNIVLRFRDLTVSHTIQEHREKIKENGKVWWGWWNRPVEKISLIFKILKEDIKNKGPIWIFLINSGLFRLYKAKVIDISFDEFGEPKECPDITMVPEYYYENKCKMWFFLEEILDTNPEELNEYAYDDPNDFIQGGSSNDRKNFKISGIEEMLSLHRTIYFITPYDDQKHAESFTAQKIGFDIDLIVEKIMVLIENIIKSCDYAPRKSTSPIELPRYPKTMERELKRKVVDDITLKDFSSSIYKLIVDGHNPVMKKDRSLISKSDFLNLSRPLYDSIRVLRCDFHHSSITPKDKEKVGDFYQDLCGVRILEDSEKMFSCQTEILKRVCNLLEEELELVKSKLLSSET